MKKKIIIIIIISIMALITIGIVTFGIFKYYSKGYVVCTKNIVTQEYHNIDLRVDIDFKDKSIIDYSAKTVYTINQPDNYDVLTEVLTDCTDRYLENGTIECKIEEKEVIKRYTLSRTVDNYVESLEDQEFTCTKTYNGL